MVASVRQPELGFGEPPPGITMVTIDPTTGGIATPSCPRTANLPFLTGTEPTQLCPVHGGLMASTTSAIAGALASGAGPAPMTPPAGAIAEQQPAPGTAGNDVLGAVGSFFGSLFGHH